MHNQDNGKKKALTKPEQDLFISYLKKSVQYEHWYPIFTIMTYTGMRVSEITGLRWCDIDMKKGMIDVNHTLIYYKHRQNGCYYNVHTPKTKSGIRTIPMLSVVKEAFEKEKEFQESAEISCQVTIDGYTDFNEPAERIERKIRAFIEWPACYSYLDGQQITTIVGGDTTQAQEAINALGNQTVYINVVARTTGVPQKFAEGGRAEQPSIFGEAGPEWAIPEEHTEHTRQLLAKAAEASGFSLLELAGSSSSDKTSSSGSDGGSSTTIVYSPTINAANVEGVERALGDDKKAFLKYMKEKLMFEKLEVYS